MKLLTVVGARPQFIKAAVVSRAIAEHNAKCAARQRIDEVIVHSGQHYDYSMSEVFFAEMKIPQPDHRLQLTKTTHGAMTGEILEGVETIIAAEKPDAVLVYGDTNTTLAGALAAVKLHIPVAHVEAGLRSFNKSMPEEINRILTDHVSTLLFCPTEHAVQNLGREGLTSGGKDKPLVENVGDVMYDAVLHYKQYIEPTSKLLSTLNGITGGFYLATVHRAKNTDDPSRLKAIIQALGTIAATKKTVVLPLHPRTRKMLAEFSVDLRNLCHIEPVGYFDMLYLLMHCDAVFTDSGGLQKEAYFMGKNCITLRDETEWVELVTGGYNVLAGADTARILAAEAALVGGEGYPTEPLYGSGDAGPKVVRLLSEFLGK